MKTLKNKQSFYITLIAVSLFTLLWVNLFQAATPISYDESVSGDLSGNSFNPVFTFDAGVNTVIGSSFQSFPMTGPATQDGDWFSFIVQPGQQLTEITFEFTNLLATGGYGKLDSYFNLRNVASDSISLLSTTPGVDQIVFETIVPLADGTYIFQLSNSAAGSGGDSATYDYTLKFTVSDQTLACVGYEPPVHDEAIKVKKNRSIPFLAKLYDNGVEVTDSDIASPPVIQVFYEASTPVEDLETFDGWSPGNAMDGNQFRYNSDFWEFILKLKNCCSAKGTYTVIMDTGDDSEYLINPTCQAQFVIQQ